MTDFLTLTEKLDKKTFEAIVKSANIDAADSSINNMTEKLLGHLSDDDKRKVIVMQFLVYRITKE